MPVPPEPTATQGRSGPGRPARLSLDLILQAAREIGLAGLTVKAVADRLGVTDASLYHHIGNRDELLRLTAEYEARLAEVPQDRGQHWAVWLQEWATHIHRSFLQPGWFGQYLQGALLVDATARNLDAVHALLAREGFDIAEATSAYDAIVAFAAGSAAHKTHRRAAGHGQPWYVEYDRFLDEREAHELPDLRRLLGHWVGNPDPDFDERLQHVLAGIATRRGEPWEPIAALLRGERDDATTRSRRPRSRGRRPA